MTYLEILRLRRVSPLVLATALSRLPIGINPLAVVLFVYERTGSFEAAGFVTGAIAVGMAGGQPFLSRLVDMRGDGVMNPIAAAHLLSIAGLLAAGSGQAPVVVLAGFAALIGFALPPTTSVLRAIWPRLLAARRDLLSGAYAIDSVLVPLTLVTGPLVVSALVAVLSIEAALVVSALSGLVGTAAFVAAAPADRPLRRSRGDLRGPLREPAILTLVIAQVPFGVAFGSMQVILPAFAEEQRHAAHAGLLMALWSLASILGALVYGVRPRRRPLHAVHLRLASLVPFGYLPALCAWSVPAMGVLVLPAGAVLSALYATRNELACVSVRPETATEAVTWPLAALLAGVALGAAIGGVAIDGLGWRAAVAVCVLAAGLGAALVWVRRATLVPAAAA